MLDLLTQDTPETQAETVSESQEAEDNIRKLLEANPQSVEMDEPEAAVYEPLKEGEVLFAHAAQQSISMISAKGIHVELPHVTSDKEMIAELTAWADHVGSIDITEAEG